MTRTIYPEPVGKSQAGALEKLQHTFGYNSKGILESHAKNPNGWNLEVHALNGMEYRQLKRALKFGYTTDVKVKRIVITRGEGPNHECHIPYIAKNWEDADEILKRMALTAPEIGYYKTDFEILFTNGDTYRGTYELSYKDRLEASLYGHVTNHCEFYGGICKKLPDHLTDDQYLSLLDENTYRYLLLLDDLIYPSANQIGLDPEIIRAAITKPIKQEEQLYRGSLTSNLTVLKVEGHQDSCIYKVLSNGYSYSSFSNSEAFNKWMDKFGLSLGEQIRNDTYHINGSYRIKMVPDRSLYLHLPQIAILMNGGMVRAYKELTPEVTNIYVVMNYKESFHFDYTKPSGQWYLRKFFWDK
ncbi:hypothetical protein ABER99_20185 [Paenibacillus glucanolyticus]|uniref:Uncharacterized protein n=1 Tax=Paenibacillus glucanolyticus TaxID=59843 RepID=A0A163GL89_9BACL|nr:hypothetical protein [Paenibacillus glucanolyticus]KZS45031.1 hypothetical protein AWU65_03350 [Paenibacillus glucanolyticus]OMF66732.1 hypothetical protein BK142_29365 [Paenibacillus glucanolyticus]